MSQTLLSMVLNGQRPLSVKQAAQVSVILGHFLFREAIPVERLVGLGLIVCGVILVVWHK
jgi:multidrug transporter EmrE-like cation transporter